MEVRRVLGVETSCDETAVAVVENGSVILSNVISSQVEIHARYGGIVPEVASRQHLLAILPALKKALSDAGLSLDDISAVAVTNGPGLAGSLLVGVNAAKAVAWARGLKLVGVNHLEAHIYANWLDERSLGAAFEPPVLPALCLIVSGGHSDLVLMTDHGKYDMLGRTRDDAAGEAFDKAARILGLGYPGGPNVERASAEGNASVYPLPRAWLKGSDDFSFSGVKTAVLHLVEAKLRQGDALFRPADVAAGFQEAVVDVLVSKTLAAANRRRVKQILIAGGVAANKALRRAFEERADVPVRFPSPLLCTDNAAMVACCGYYHLMRNDTAGLDLDAIPGLKLVADRPLYPTSLDVTNTSTSAATSSAGTMTSR